MLHLTPAFLLPSPDFHPLSAQRRPAPLPHSSIRSFCILYSRALSAFRPHLSSSCILLRESSSFSLVTFPSILPGVSRLPFLIAFILSISFYFYFFFYYTIIIALLSPILFSFLPHHCSLFSLFELSPLTHSNFLTFVFLPVVLSHRSLSSALFSIPLLTYSISLARIFSVEIFP